MPSRVRSNPIPTLLAVISALLILVGRVNHEEAWGLPLTIAGIAVLVLAGGLFLVTRR